MIMTNSKKDTFMLYINNILGHLQNEQNNKSWHLKAVLKSAIILYYKQINQFNYRFSETRGSKSKPDTINVLNSPWHDRI